MNWSKHLVLWSQIIAVSAASAKPPVSHVAMPTQADSRHEAPAVQFSSEQQDRFVTNDYIRRNDSAIYHFGAIAFAVWGAENNYDKKGEFRVDGWASDPSSFSAYQSHLTTPKTKKEYLELAAENQNNTIKGYKIRGTSGEALIDSALGLASLRLGPAAPVVLPLVKEGVIRAIEVSPQDPNISPDATRNMFDWASEQIRKDTPAGKVLAKYLNDLKIPDPRKDRSDTAGVQAAQAAYVTVKTSRDVSTLVDQNKNVQLTVKQIGQKIEALTETLKAAADGEAKAKKVIEIKPNQEAAIFFRDAASSLTSMSYILTLTNNPKEAEMIEKIARVAKAMELASTAAQYSALAAANIYLYAAVMIYSAIKVSSAPQSPYPAIFKMLARLSKQIEDLRAELGVRLNQLDSKIGAFIIQSNAFNEAQLQNINVVNQVLTRLQMQLRELKSDSERQVKGLANLILDGEDRQCFQEYQKSRFLPLTINEFVKCRTTYVDRATRVARSWITEGGQGSAATKNAYRASFFQDADRYEKLRLRIDADQNEYTRTLATPALWTESAQAIAALARTQPQFLNNFDQQLDGVMETGADLRAFRDSLLFTYEGGKKSFRKARVEFLLNEMATVQKKALAKIQLQLLASGSTIDPTKGFSQPVNRDYPFQFLAQPIPYCAETAPRVLSYIVVNGAGPGCGKGCVTAHDSRVVPNDGVRGTLDEGMKTVTAQQLALDKRILRVISPELMLAEQSNHLRTKLHVCISRMDLANINQAPNMVFGATVGLSLNVYVSVDTPEGRSPATLVQQVDMQSDFQIPARGSLVVHRYGPQIQGDFMNKWNEIWETLSANSRDVSAESAVKTRAFIKARMVEYFEKHRVQLASPLISALQEEETEFKELARDLRAMLNIGLRSGGGVSGKAFAQVLASDLWPHTPIRFAQSAVNMGMTIEALGTGLLSQQQALKEGLETLAKDATLAPPEDVISVSLRALNQVYWLQAVPKKIAKRSR